MGDEVNARLHRMAQATLRPSRFAPFGDHPSEVANRSIQFARKVIFEAFDLVLREGRAEALPDAGEESEQAAAAYNWLAEQQG